MQSFSWQTSYIAALSLVFFAVGVWHIVAGDTTERVFRDPKVVRVAGVGILLSALPSFAFQERYFLVLGAVLVASGLSRMVNPGINIKLQKKTWPRWGHGCIIVGFAVLLWVCWLL